MDKHHILVNFVNSDKRVWFVLKEKNYQQLYDPVINYSYVVPSYLIYKFGKRCIITNKVPDDGVYILKKEYTYGAI